MFSPGKKQVCQQYRWGGMMGSVRHLCLWLLVCVFGLPSFGGWGLHAFLPRDVVAVHQCGAAVFRCSGTDVVHSAISTRGGLGYSRVCPWANTCAVDTCADGVACAVDVAYVVGAYVVGAADDGCFVCRYFFRHCPGFVLLASVLLLGLIVSRAAEPVLFFVLLFCSPHLARSPPFIKCPFHMV